MAEQKIYLGSQARLAELFGSQDENLALIENNLGVQVLVRDNNLLVYGSDEALAQASRVLEQLLKYSQAGNALTRREINYALKLLEEEPDESLEDLANTIVYTTSKGKKIKPKTVNQKKYLKSLEKKDVVFAVGPAGTGKTYLAVVMATKALKAKKVQRLILTRPAVEAGENLGFLPGDLQDKVDPYLRPLYDGLYDVLGWENTQKLIERHIIEIAPLAYMRGRTLDNAYVILDEAQNTTIEQMKMFLTRLGFGSKAVITGDVTQIDLPPGKVSGLIHAQKILHKIEGLDFCYLNTIDVVRHPLVQEIIQAYAAKTKDEQ
ncbi:MAG: PhoH family protein [Clostridia bacterium]|nr:PhoH family protein [Clostridia bacterium]